MPNYCECPERVERMAATRSILEETAVLPPGVRAWKCHKCGKHYWKAPETEDEKQVARALDKLQSEIAIWEYKTINAEDIPLDVLGGDEERLTQGMNRLGWVGWEMCGVFENFFFFKRQKGPA